MCWTINTLIPVKETIIILDIRSDGTLLDGNGHPLAVGKEPVWLHIPLEGFVSAENSAHELFDLLLECFIDKSRLEASYRTDINSLDGELKEIWQYKSDLPSESRSG